MTSDDQTRSFELEVEVAGTPEEVWAAIATGPGITAWLHPTELDEREGGRMTYDMGGGAGGEATVRGWDPPRRFVEEAEWAAKGTEPALLATEWRVEARSGGTCLVRMVTSGFPTGGAWDDEIEGFTEAMTTALENLRLYRAHFPGERATWVRAFGSAPGTWADALPALTRALGMPDARAGTMATTSGAGAPALAGRVERVDEGKWQGHVLLRVDEPAPGLASVSAWGEAAATTVQLCLYGDAGAAAAARDGEAWKAWMKERFPARARAA